MTFDWLDGKEDLVNLLHTHTPRTQTLSTSNRRKGFIPWMEDFLYLSTYYSHVSKFLKFLLIHDKTISRIINYMNDKTVKSSFINLSCSDGFKNFLNFDCTHYEKKLAKYLFLYFHKTLLVIFYDDLSYIFSTLS